MQVYLNEITLYGQGGWVTADKAFDTVDDGLFARGVARWFPTADSRLQIEATYVTYDYVFSNLDGDAEILSGKVRYDFTLAGMPVVGDVPVYLAYRGTHRDNCYFGSDITDHTKWSIDFSPIIDYSPCHLLRRKRQRAFLSSKSGRMVSQSGAQE
jgi:hypothetical protein